MISIIVMEVLNENSPDSNSGVIELIHDSGSPVGESESCILNFLKNTTKTTGEIIWRGEKLSAQKSIFEIL
jgi:hypothetical protein